MKQYVCRNLCENLRQTGQKNEVIAYASWVVRSDRGVVRTSRADGMQGGGVMVQCIHFFFSKLYNAIASYQVFAM